MLPESHADFAHNTASVTWVARISL